jgi:hypothetical protein
LRLKSFVVIFILVSLLFFIFQRVVDGIQIPGELFQVKITGKYSSLLGGIFDKLHVGQVWRLISIWMGFLYMNQWVSLTIMSLFFVTMVESIHGVKTCLGELIFFF